MVQFEKEVSCSPLISFAVFPSWKLYRPRAELQQKPFSFDTKRGYNRM